MGNLAKFFAALADENRLRLLHLLKDGEVCVCHLQGVLQTNQPKISRHLAYLRRAGLVAARKDGRWTHYRLKLTDKYAGKLLAETLDCLGRQAAVKKDTQRLKQVICCS